MPYYRKTIISGNVIEVYEYRSLRKIGENYTPRTGPVAVTPEEKEVINIKNARLRLTRLINCNFTNNDTFLRLSYKKKPEEEEAIKKLRNFIRRLNYHTKKQKSEPLKYVAVTEKAKGRIHHHLVLNCSDYNLLKQLWGKNGGFFVIGLYTDDYEDLANYITKETIRCEHGKRWSQSRNLKKPDVSVVEIDRVSDSEIQPPSGYKTLESTLYVSDLTGSIRYIKAVKQEVLNPMRKNE